MKIVVVLPAYNCAKSLKKTISEIPQDVVNEIVLVDDFSSDDTIEVAKECCIRHIIKHDRNLGYGANQKTCYDTALILDADIIVMLHPDYQYDPKAYLKIPAFIEAKTIDEANNWKEIINELILITKNIKGSIKNEEDSNAIQGLDKLRNYISTAKIESFLDFQFWYSKYMMFAFTKKQNEPSKWNVKAFRTSTLDQLFKNTSMSDYKISEIISNEGFQKVAYAIRKSTVTLQYTPKAKRKFDIRYGLAQTLQVKSKSSNELAEFIGEFIGIYNTETARFKERHPEMDPKKIRAIVKVSELTSFFRLVDDYPSKVVGALLASYGFALTDKELIKDGDEEQTENEETMEEMYQ